ncbi:MAG TPA: hypothetical protein ENN46_04580 [Candidatus Woesearchaeota archaeon]|nr:hypothetical protein [Candidatus Woesearchaeota archaeon]
MVKIINRAQFNLEFIIFFVTSMIIMSVLAYFFSTIFTESKEERLASSLNEVAYYLASEIQMASSLKDGYSKQMLLPQKVNGEEYFIRFSGNRIWVEQDERSSEFFSVPQFLGSFNNMDKANNWIGKRNQLVFIYSE